jgi:FkbM family methyltransferase
LFSEIRLRSIEDAARCLMWSRHPHGDCVDLFLTGQRAPIRLRTRTSDTAVFQEVMIHKQYDIPALKNVEYVLDCGANVGLTSVYLLRKYPKARVIAIEPDPENFAIASFNLKPYGERCQLLNAAVWHEPGELEVSQGTFRDGRHWATQTLPVSGAGKITVPSYPIRALMERFQFPRLDLLKIDIEGAELPIFRDGDVSFLKDTRCVAIELHGAECETAFLNAIQRYGHTVSTQNELHVAIRE